MPRRLWTCLWLAAMCNLLASAGEAELPLVRIEANAGSSLEYPLGLPGGGVSAKGLNLPAGLRMRSDGTIVGTPLQSGETLSSAIALNQQNLAVAIQNLQFVIGGGGSSVGSRSSGISLASRLTSSVNPALTGEQVVFTVAAVCANKLKYEWNFGDGNVKTGTSGSATHSYAATGSYQVSVKISDGVNQIADIAGISVVGSAAARAVAAPRAADPLPKKSVGAPFEAFRISGVFDTTHAYSVRFIASKTVFMDVEASEVTSTSLSVAIPPIPKGTSFKGGNVTLKIIDDGFISDVEGKLKVLDLPKLKVGAGVTTRSFLNSQKTMLEQLRPKLEALGIVPAQTLASVDTNIGMINTLSGRVASATGAPKKDKLALAIIKNSDRFIQGMLSSGGKVGNGAFAIASTAWLDALKSGDENAILAAEANFIAAYLEAIGARAAREVEQVSDAAKFTTGALGVIGGLIGATGVILTVAGEATAGAALITGAAAVGTAALAVGVTFATTVAVAGAVAYAAGDNNGKKLLNESKEIFVETGKDVLIEKGAGAIAGKIANSLNGVKAGEAATELVEVAVNTVDATGDLVEATPEFQSTGTFSAGLFRSGDSYFVVVKSANTANAITVTVNGTDGFSISFSGMGTVTTSVIPAGAAGVTDTIVCTDTVTGETQSFAFTF